MAVAHSFEAPDRPNRSVGSRASAITSPTVGRLARELGRSRRHTLFVKFARLLLPIGAVAAAAAFVVDFAGFGRKLSIAAKGGRIEIGQFHSVSSDGVGMANPRYRGFGQDGSRYEVTAKHAITDLTGKSPVRLETIAGELAQPDGSVTRLSAARGSIETKSNVLTLDGGIRIANDKGLTADLQRATVETKEGRISSADPVLVTLPNGEVRGNSLIILQKRQEIAFDNGVVTRLVPPARQTGRDEMRSAGPLPFAATQAPIEITSVRLVVKDSDKTAEFLGNVRAVQGESALAAPILIVRFSGTQMPGAAATPKAEDQRATGAQQTPARAPESAAGPADGQGRIKTIVARDGVVMTRGADRLTSQQLVYNAEVDRAQLTGGIVMNAGDDRSARSDQAELDNKADTATLSGNVVVVQGQNSLRGARLLVNRKAQTLEMTGLGEAGRVHATLVQPAQAGKARRTEPATGLAGQFRTSPGTPVQIDAKRLDVDDRAHNATFRGDVVAVQGDFSLKSAELVASYQGGSGFALASEAGRGQTETAARAPARLTRIHARTRVVVKTGENRTATGDWADFDVAANTVTLGGKVTLSEGRQIVNGDRLVIDLTTGLSQLKQTPGVAAGPSGARPDPASGQCGGRMCAVFYPKDIEDAQKRANAQKRQAAPQTAPSGQKIGTSGWSTDTTLPRR